MFISPRKKVDDVALIWVCCIIQADVQRLHRGEKAIKLEQASRLLQKCFSACLNDRCVVLLELELEGNKDLFFDGVDFFSASDQMASRKIGTYYMATLLFKTYFQVRCSDKI